MKLKILSIFLLTAIMCLAVVSAAQFTVTQPSSLSKSVNETSFVITNTNSTESITVNVPKFADISDEDNHKILLIQSDSGPIVIENSTSKTITISYSSLEPSTADLEDLALGDFSSKITLTEGSDSSDVTLNFISNYCERGDIEEEIEDGTRTLEIVSIKDKSSSDDWEWKPLDKIDVEVKVRFDSDDKDDSVDAIIKVGLYDLDQREFVDLGDEDDFERDVSMDEGEKATEIFTIQVPVEDIQDSTSRYKLYVKVYEDGEEDTLCADLIGGDEQYQSIKIDKKSYDVILDEIDFTSPVPCGQEVELTVRVSNIGTHDEDKVQVNIFNKELGLDLKKLLSDLNEGDSEKISFNFLIPEGSDEKVYTLRLSTEFRYRDSSDTFREESDPADVLLTIEGNCKEEVVVPSVVITAELDDETPKALAGKQVLIKATFRNTGTEPTNYFVTVSGHSTWSSLNSIDPQTVPLMPGESRDANILLDIDADAEGEKEFTIKAAYNDQITEQKVALTIEAPEEELDAVAQHLKDNWFIYVIILINIILIIAIIAVISRMVRGPAH